KAEEIRFLLTTGEARALVYHAAFAPLVAEVRADLPLIQISDDSGNPLLPGALDYETWLAAETDAPLDLPYSPDDLYLIFTGATRTPCGRRSSASASTRCRSSATRSRSR